jgi:hypothetical protein
MGRTLGSSRHTIASPRLLNTFYDSPTPSSDDGGSKSPQANRQRPNRSHSPSILFLQKLQCIKLISAHTRRYSNSKQLQSSYAVSPAPADPASAPPITDDVLHATHKGPSISCSANTVHVPDWRSCAAPGRHIASRLACSQRAASRRPGALDREFCSDRVRLQRLHST